MSAAAGSPAVTVSKGSRRLAKFVARLPLHLVIIGLALLWMTPTVGLLSR